MKKFASFITKRKVFVIIFFLIAAITSAIFITKVNINYDISKYLNSESETSQALEITEDEFGLNGNMQVMISNIDQESSKEIKDKIEEVQYVISVKFDAYDTNYYKDNNALYVLIIDGDDYSENAKSVTNDIKVLLSQYQTSYGGTAIDKQRLQEAIQNEMVYIIVISVSLAAGIILLMSESWLDPILLLSVAGIAILINLGTNAFFPSISYITNSISAILQLALSIDYSIVLLNTYRKNKKELSKEEAMKKAIVQVIKPVSASGLTTLAGLCALLFMSYRIGFDIGIVLMKGIVISLITSITLLPGVILLLDRLLEKTHKKTIHLSGNFFANIAKKANKVLVPLSLCLIAGCGVLNYNSTYTYSNQSNVDTSIEEVFSKNNQFMVVFPNTDYQTQEDFIKEIKGYRTENGEDVFVDYTSYTNTVLEQYDLDKIVKKLDISNEEAEMLISMYDLYNNKDFLKLTFEDTIDYSYYLINNDDDAKTFATSDTKNTIEKLIAIKSILKNENTYEELYTSLTNEPLNDLSNNIDKFSLKQLYGLYFYNSIEDNKVAFNVMLDYMVDIFQNDEHFSSKIDSSTMQMLVLLDNQVNEKINEAITPIDKVTFQQLMYAKYNVTISDEQASLIYKNYYLSKGLEEKETIPYLELMNFLVKSNLISDESSIEEINNANDQYLLVTSKYSYNEFLPVLNNVVYANTGLQISLSINDNDMQMIYIKYFDQLKYFDSYKLSGDKFVNYAKYLYENNEYIKSQISQDVYSNICDMSLINTYVNDTNAYDYSKQYKNIKDLQNNLNIKIENNGLDEDSLSGVYIKYIVNNNKTPNISVIAKDLLDFINLNKESNSLLKKKLTEKNLNKINKANNDIETANRLFKGKTYSRLLITMDLDNEGKDTENFITYLKDTSTKYFGEKSYIAGESVSTNDLKESFKLDEIIISVVTIVSILIITAVTFKSASLPVILIIIIQGACWIAFSTNLITGPVFFMSYIIASCILMGATVDYGILMSTNYIENRKTMNKEEALKNAIQASLPTIFTSGLILTICGFVICFVSSQASISSVGLLVGKGTLVAVILILFVLPSFLYLLDKIILKTTYQKKKKEN